MKDRHSLTVGAIAIAVAAFLGNGCFTSHTEKTEVVHDRPTIVHEETPPQVVETPGVMPRDGAVWTPGHWDRDPRGWLWVPGSWR